MVRVVGHRKSDYQIECGCGAILQFNKTDINTWTQHEWDFSVTYHEITCPDCHQKIQLQKPFDKYEVNNYKELLINTGESE